MDLLIKNAAILPMTDRKSFIERGYIRVADGVIEEVSPGEPAPEFAGEVVDAQGMVAMPGLINAHTHVAMTLMRSYADDLPLKEWLENKIWPYEGKMSPEDVYWGSLLGMVEMIKSGTTCFADMYFFEDQVARAASEAGMRAVVARGMVGVGPENMQSIGESRDLVKEWHGAQGGRITVMLGPHAPYTCPPDYLKNHVLPLARELNVGIHIHLAETKPEFHDMTKQYGRTPIDLMRDTGMFEHKVLAAHCVHLTDDDIRILADHGAGVAHNPESNMKLASGVARVPEILSAGIAVGLGTDGPASNNNLDMFGEMRSAALLHKVQAMDPMAVPAFQALSMATVLGARAIGLEGVTGALSPGLKADIILVDMDKPHLTPCHDVVSNLVYSASGSDVDTVIVDGRLLMKGRKLLTLDERLIMDEVKKRARR